MALARKRSSLDRRLREIEREKRRVRERMREVRRWADPLPESDATWLESNRPSSQRQGYGAASSETVPPPVAVGVLEMEAPMAPDQEVSLDFAPGPEGLNVKRVVMPRLQRTDLLRPSIGGQPVANRLLEPEHERFRNYIGSMGLRRVREARRERGSHRLRAMFMIGMVLLLGYILFKMLT